MAVHQEAEIITVGNPKKWLDEHNNYKKHNKTSLVLQTKGWDMCWEQWVDKWVFVYIFPNCYFLWLKNLVIDMSFISANKVKYS